ncbi:thioesterase family protein [Halomonas elongata]|uniref:Thioesterase domain protein n=1 Tax=Halomonas elongata (strain ATCC 33173 / DSM 2581 / NBRC 15536 / NCIMB 2198 / 1H9) TaxID=768066 RepID=E1V3F4_HALED|nr:thioesterase family protein [Halomonas elongata]WBF19929.1 thioesterase family protein [Halomonas elongata]WPU48798.1 thioesterase family protein [Halomonas elongata DSM 2581]CBV42633.1 thioesterase domain protein [Halomonas elongata DSM 2581]
MALLETRVDPQWVDYNGHMNDAEYARAFSLAVEALMDRLGLDESGRARHGYTLYTLETHLCYRREAHEGQALHLEVTLLERDAKRLHVFFEMRDDEHNLLATSEQMLMGIDSQAGRPAPFPAEVDAAVEILPRAEPDAWPELAGRRIGLPPAKR